MLFLAAARRKYMLNLSVDNTNSFLRFSEPCLEGLLRLDECDSVVYVFVSSFLFAQPYKTALFCSTLHGLLHISTENKVDRRQPLLFSNA